MKATLFFLCNNGRHLSLEHLFSPLVVIYRAFFIIISKPICGGKSPHLSTCQSLDFPLIFVMQQGSKQQSSLGSKARITVFKIHRPRKWHPFFFFPVIPPREVQKQIEKRRRFVFLVSRRSFFPFSPLLSKYGLRPQKKEMWYLQTDENGFVKIICLLNPL